MNKLLFEDILNYTISASSVHDCISLITSWIALDDKNRYVLCVNPHSLEVARKDHVFGGAIQSADLVVPDGIGIIIASKILGGNIRERVTGYDIFWGVSEILNKEKKYNYYFIGSTEDNLTKIKWNMKRDFPNINVAGVYAPPFKDEFSDEDNNKMIEAVNKERPDVLWVGMTAPKQEKWIYQNKEKLNVKCIGAIGAVFDFYSGRIRRTHPFFQNMGLEWLLRLMREPRRLWKRNVISSPSFIFRVIKYKYLNSRNYE